MAAKICERPGCGELRVVSAKPRTRWLALTDEHDHLLSQLSGKIDAVITTTRHDRWPALELRSLIGYLNEELLPRANRQEQELSALHASAAKRAQLSRDHDRLRAGTAALARAAAGEGSNSPAQLAAIARSILTQFERHLATEVALLRADEEVGSDTTRVFETRPVS